MNAGACVWFRIFGTFAIFADEEVCEVVLIISGRTEYEFSAAIFIKLSKL